MEEALGEFWHVDPAPPSEADFEALVGYLAEQRESHRSSAVAGWMINLRSTVNMLSGIFSTNEKGRTAGG